MKIHFCKSNDIGGFLIRLFTFSRWNHVAIEIDGVVFEAVTGDGVQAVRAETFAGRWAKTEAVTVRADNPAEAKRFLSRQLGKPYDWLAIVALPFRESWQHPDKWFCSELATQALRLGGATLPGRIPSGRVTPRDLWMALPES